MISYGKQTIEQDDIDAVIEALKGDYLTCGNTIDLFEKMLAERTGAKYAVAVSNGTAALHIAYMAAGLKAGDEVITTPITFAATANAALYCGAGVRFADIDVDSGNIDVNKIAELINSKTKIITPVHYAGQTVDMKSISAIAKKYGTVVIEDACHALGAIYDGNPVGCCCYSDMSVFSFHPVKHITTGEGGAITTNNIELYHKLKLLRSHGIESKDNWNKDMIMLGYNYRLTDIQAALGISQLKRLDKFITLRKAIAKKYDQCLADHKYVKPLKVKEDHSYHLYPVLLDNKINRIDFLEKMKSNGIMLQIHYKPVYTHSYYKANGYKSLPVADFFSDHVVSLPIYPQLSNDDFDYVIKTMDRIFAEFNK